jgi:hypothetical protein
LQRGSFPQLAGSWFEVQDAPPFGVEGWMVVKHSSSPDSITSKSPHPSQKRRRIGRPQIQRRRQNQEQVQQQKQNNHEKNYLSGSITATAGFIVGNADAKGRAIRPCREKA